MGEEGKREKVVEWSLGWAYIKHLNGLLFVCLCVFTCPKTPECAYRNVCMCASHSAEPSATLLRAERESEHLAVSQRCIAP